MVLTFFVGLVTLGVVFFVGYPFIQRRMSRIDGNEYLDSRTADLQRAKESSYSAIREIEFDYNMGKLSDEDYHELREKYRSQAISILKEIDEIGEEDIEEEVEREIASLRNVGEAVSCPKCLTVNPLDSKFCGNCGTSLAEPCPHCGRTVVGEAKFCPYCGNKLASLCSSCGSRYEAEDKFCGRCGTKLG
jgi:RNA polymerase subunit RPABC4/transcription elongation factor Spt4